MPEYDPADCPLHYRRPYLTCANHGLPIDSYPDNKKADTGNNDVTIGAGQMADDVLQPEKNPTQQASPTIPELFTSGRFGTLHQRSEFDRFVASVFGSGGTFYYVIDLSKQQQPLQASPSIEAILGLAPRAVTFQAILDRVHPQDRTFATQAEKTALAILEKKLGPQQIKNYKVSFTARMRTAEGRYYLFNHQAMVLAEDNHGRPTRLLRIHTDISHLASHNNFKVSLLSLRGGEDFLNLDVLAKAEPAAELHANFTRREREILDLLAAGKTSVEIARVMSISPHTVKNHRKNILRKANCKSTSQLISQYISEGSKGVLHAT
ncbi:PAS domain-containing protein [Microbulbifer salipaludis]|uniref:PAS domain-containing protein n=1 Tax=Microbulbifer salipaludis TaxID=187980 RepID=A0ABS3E3B7_9GAMM|nr:LuxR C-terminal-related transcriptional regulator [Microbulbifer salipaludis]MBN8429781.1 PAS domain-containing protein [Microbulbifer salipaludis]